MITAVKHKSSILALTLFCFLVGSAWIPNQSSQESICLIPEGLTGPVFIIFGQAGGAEPEIENGKHLYRIPRSGVLKTKVKADYRLHRHEFYYVDKRGRRTKLEYLYPG